MENLSDAEFGSDNNEKEAPLLVAQRYLNIFRQVHIFNKAKRDEFDDELLALPTNITDFFKRMPGGRLLVEHIEKVKTARGISFVKTSREEFDEGAGKAPNSSPTTANAPAGAGGGTLVLDANFAETLAQSMAQAFKQIPMSSNAPVSGGTSVDFGGAFDVIAEEIRMSRSSLLDVLKETRSVTDSVIASQVSISRILESILSSRTRDDADVTNLNNRIIASQASITKLLEGIYTASSKRDTEISDYLNVEAKLADFRNDVENKVENFRSDVESKVDSTLTKMQSMLDNYAKAFSDRKIIIETNNIPEAKSQTNQVPNNSSYKADSTDTVHEIHRESHAEKAVSYADKTKFFAEKNTVNSTPQRSAVSEQQEVTIQPKPEEDFPNRSGSNVAHNAQPSENRENIAHANTSRQNPQLVQQKNPLNDGEQRKKKKKKKKHDNVSANGETVSTNNQPIKNRSRENEQRIRPEVVKAGVAAVPVIDGIIRNSEYKYDDDFKNVQLDEPIIQKPRAEVTPKADIVNNLPKSEYKHDDFKNTRLDEPVMQKSRAEETPKADLINNLPDLDELTNHISDDDNIFNPETPIDMSNIPTLDSLEDDGFDYRIENPDDFIESVSEDLPNPKDIDASHFELSKGEVSQAEDISTPISDDTDSSHVLPNLDELSNDDALFTPETPSDVNNIPTPENLEDNNFDYGIENPDDFIESGSEDLPNPSDFSNDSLDDIVPTERDFTEDKLAELDEPFDWENDEAPKETEPKSDLNLDDIALSDNHLNESVETDDFDINISDEDLPNFDTEEESNAPETVAVSEPSQTDIPLNTGSSDLPNLDDLVGDDIEFDLPQQDSSEADSLSDLITSDEPQKAINEPQTDEETHVEEEQPEEMPVADEPEPEQHSNSMYSAELEKIRQALTADNVDIASLDEPIALDDYNDDENVEDDEEIQDAPQPTQKEDEDWEWEYVDDENSEQAPTENTESTPSTDENGEDWDWEYVDENGEPLPEGQEGEDWEWEYVDDENSDDEKKK